MRLCMPTRASNQSAHCARRCVPFFTPQWREGWEECDTELSFNKLRVPSLAHGQIGAFQLGSVTYGKVNDEDAEKGLVFWDVFVQVCDSAGRRKLALGTLESCPEWAGALFNDS